MIFFKKFFVKNTSITPIPEDFTSIKKISKEITDIYTNEFRADYLLATRQLIEVVLLHCYYIEEDKTLRGVRDFFCNPDKSNIKLLNIFLRAEHDREIKNRWVNVSGHYTKLHPHIHKVMSIHASTEESMSYYEDIARLAKMAIIEFVGDVPSLDKIKIEEDRPLSKAIKSLLETIDTNEFTGPEKMDYLRGIM